MHILEHTCARMLIFTVDRVLICGHYDHHQAPDLTQGSYRSAPSAEVGYHTSPGPWEPVIRVSRDGSFGVVSQPSHGPGMASQLLEVGHLRLACMITYADA
jgi:hypothetical protein